MGRWSGYGRTCISVAALMRMLRYSTTHRRAKMPRQRRLNCSTALHMWPMGEHAHGRRVEGANARHRGGFDDSLGAHGTVVSRVEPRNVTAVEPRHVSYALQGVTVVSWICGASGLDVCRDCWCLTRCRLTRQRRKRPVGHKRRMWGSALARQPNPCAIVQQGTRVMSVRTI